MAYQNKRFFYLRIDILKEVSHDRVGDGRVRVHDELDAEEKFQNMKSNFKCESSIVWTEDTPSSIFLLLQLYHLLGLSTTLRIKSLNPRLLKELPNSKRYKFHYYTSIFTRRVFRKS